MSREGTETIVDLADLRWQRDALIKLAEELQRELKKEEARMRGTNGAFAELA